MPVTVALTSPPSAAPIVAEQAATIVISVTSYQLPQNGAVQAVVTVVWGDTGQDQEFGRFSLFAPFKAVDASKAQRFAIPLPKDIASERPLILKIQLVPLYGNVDGAYLDIGGAETH